MTTFTGPGIQFLSAITPGPDRALWFPNLNSQNISIGRITTTGEVTVSPIQPLTIRTPSAGSDGALWFTNGSKIGRITTTGRVTLYSTGTEPFAITAGPDGALWFVSFGENIIGRITTSVTPQIADENPQSGPVGTRVTVTCFNLGGATKVAFDGTAAPIISDTATTVVTQVPAGATTGLITITTHAGTATA